MSRTSMMRALAGTAGVLLVGAAAAPGAAATRTADSGDVQATVRKTVLQTATSTGEILTSRMYTQVSAAGSGTKTVTVPVGVDSNRNLNQFGPFPMEGQSIVFELDVDGGVEERTLTDADISPMEVSVKVMLDGIEVEPADLVGADGVVDVQYTVRNTTARTEDVTFTDVEGNEITEPVELAEPYAGSLDITLPQGFNEITAPGATVAGDGTNQTSLGYTMVLFPPLGSSTATVGYQARVTNGQMPAAVFSFLPIVPFDNSTIAGTAEAYKGGAAVGASIFDAGVQIGDNLLKLQEGAGQLVAGLGQLSAGASQLSDGLVNTAAPGAAALADGTGQVSDGLGELNSNVPALADGVEQLDDGANQLSDGLNALDANVPALESGVSQLNGGAQQLSTNLAAFQENLKLLAAGVENLLPAVQQNDGYKQLQGALQAVIAAIGTKPDLVADPKTLGQALTSIDLGLSNINCDPTDPTNAANPCGVKEVLEILQQKLGDAAASGGDIESLTEAAIGAYQQASSPALPGFPAPNCPTNAAVPVPPVVPPSALPIPPLTTTDICFLLSNVAYGLGLPAGVLAPDDPGGLQAQTDTAAKTLGQVAGGIGDAGTNGTILNGLAKVWVGLSNPNCDLAEPTDPANPCGIKQIQGLVSAGIDELVTGISQLLQSNLGSSDPAANCDPTKTLTCAGAALAAGATQLAAGTSQLNSQVPTLAAGVSQLAAGGDKLAAGTGELNSQVPTLASGVQQLDDGAAQVDDGANQLSDGLGAAADGSVQLADGLGQAEPGGAQIEDGAGQLKEQGADELAKTGKEAQLGYARDVALLEAAQLMGVEGTNIPFGPAEGTDVTTTAAVQLQLAGITADSENNLMKYGLGAALIAGAAGAAYAARRRLTA